MPFQVEVGSKEPLLFGEAPLWDKRSNKLFLVDCFDKSVVSFEPNSKNLIKKRVTNSEDLKYIMVAIPYATAKEQNKFLVASSNSRLTEFDWERGETTKLWYDFKSENPSLPGGFHLSDAKCDAKGRLWIGTAVIGDMGTLVVKKDKGELNRFEKTQDSLKLERFCEASGFEAPNGFGWNLANDKLYYNDLTKRTITIFDFDLESGTLQNQKIFFDFNANPELAESFPDGLVVDTSGHVWVACWKGSSVIKIDGQTGQLLAQIKLPVTNTTSLCFGGPDFKTLFVTTTSVELDTSPVIGQPDAGKIFQITSPEDNSFQGFQHHFFV